MADDLTADSFSEHEGSAFTIHVGSDTVELELVDVIEHEYDSTEGYSVLFRGSDDQVFEHGTYAVQHNALGTHEFAVGPVVSGRESDDGQHFEAVFSRLKEPMDAPERG